MKPATDLTYRAFLLRELESRTRRVPGYSLRAYARDLGIQSSKLSESLNERGGFSKETASRIALKLRLAPEEREYFVNLVELEHSRSKSGKKQAAERLEVLRASKSFDELGLERFRVIADWYHLAILELMETPAFQSDAAWIARRLDIPKDAAVQALDRLAKFGLFERDDSGRMVRSKKDLATPSGIPSREIREHHSQILRKAEESLEKVPVPERDFSTMTMAIDPSKFSEATQALREFRRKFCKDMQDSPQKERVYCLSIQFFPLDVQEPSK